MVAKRRRVVFSFDERSLEPIERLVRQGRIPGGEVHTCFPTTPPSLEEVYGLTGEVEIGDEVKTLHFKRAVYGVVTRISKKKIATVRGETQPGAGLRTISAHVENLAIIKKGKK
jgi:hypothetical protein